MAEYKFNPRKCSKEQLEQLKSNIIELGDLSGIVHDVNSDEIISGNQRSSIIEVNKCNIELIHEFKNPTKTGTVAVGFIHFKNEKYFYRKVSWNKEQCEKANITANLLGGEWDWKILKENFGDDFLTNECGFDQYEIENTFESIGVDSKDNDINEVINIQIGFFSFKLDVSVYNKWEKKMFDEFENQQDIIDEIIKRLEL